MSGGFPPFIEFCNGNDIGTVTGSSTGTSVTSGTANNYGSSYTALTGTGGSPYDTEFILLNVYWTTSFNADSVAVNLAVGASGSEKLIATNLLVSLPTSGTAVFNLPLSIPSGTRISVAIAAHVASQALAINAQLFSGSFFGSSFAGVDSLGYTSSAVTGTTITASSSTNTKGSYTELTPSATGAVRDYCGIMYSLDSLNGAATTTNGLMDIAVGASGSQKNIIPNILVTDNGSAIITPVVVGFVPISIPAGAHVWARWAATTASATIGVTAYGLYR